MEQRPTLLDEVREMLRLKHYAPKTGESYLCLIRRYLHFHKLRHRREMGAPEIQVFLSHSAIREKVAASTRNQAFSALLFLYRDVLGVPTNPGACQPPYRVKMCL